MRQCSRRRRRHPCQDAITVTVANAVAVAISIAVAGPCQQLASLSCVDVLLPPLSVHRQHHFVHRHFRRHRQHRHVGCIYIIVPPSIQSHLPSFQPLLLASRQLLPLPLCQPLMQSPSTAIDTIFLASTSFPLPLHQSGIPSLAHHNPLLHAVVLTSRNASIPLTANPCLLYHQHNE